jgi:hypothetical protein
VCLEPAKPCLEDKATIKKLVVLDCYPDSTVKSTVKRLSQLASLCNLKEPDTVKKLLSEKNVSDSFKSNLCDSYGHYLDCHGLSWTRPKYRRVKGLPRVLNSETVEKIIARCSWKYATEFSLLRGTGAMPEELHRVTRRDVNLDTGVICLPGCKYHKSRNRKVKENTLAMLKRYLEGNSELLPFPTSTQQYDAWRRSRNPIATKTIHKLRQLGFMIYAII